MADPDGPRKASDSHHGNAPMPPVSPHPERLVLQESVDSLSASLSDQIESLACELRSRWKAGQRDSLEALGPQFAQLSGNSEHLLDLIYHEILIREEFGEIPRLEDYSLRFPEYVDRLHRLFAVHGALENDSSDNIGTDFDSRFSHADDSPFDDLTSDRDSSENDRSGKCTPQWPRKARVSLAVDAPPGYELLEEIGRGGMAVVYRARQLILNRTVAIKMLLGGSMASQEVLARIQQEARAVAQLQHPGIVQIHEVGEHRGLPFLSLEFVPGGTLHEWLNGQPLSPLEACRIVEQLARITHFAHEQGIVHRDLKPANVLLTERPGGAEAGRTLPLEASRSGSASTTMSFFVKISDFGLARVLGHRSDLTATGQVIGTPSYMAPEQASGSTDEAAPAQDIYSLGAILFELLTGRPPFRGATLFDTLEQVREDEPVPPRRLQPRVPKDLDTVCLKCLEKIPHRRYVTALELAEDLRAVQCGDSVRARPVGRLERGWKWVRRSPAVASLLLLILLLTVTGIAGILVESRRAKNLEAESRQERDRALRLSLVASNERDEAKLQRSLAERQTLKADQQAQQAEYQRTLAEAARTEAIVARQQAESNMEQALTAIDALARLGIELRQTPLQQVTSRRILDETLKLYDQLEESHGDSSRLRRQLASTLVRAGEIRSVLRENEKAAELLQRAVNLLAEELQHSPEDMAILDLAAYANWVHGNFFNTTDRPSEAIAAYERSLAAHDTALRLRPDSGYHLRDKANTIINICAALNNLNRAPESLPRYEQAIRILRSLRDQRPDNVSIQSELALSLHDYSRILRIFNGHEPATRAFDEAIEIRGRLFARNPNDMGNRALYARLFYSRGVLLRQSRDYANSVVQFHRTAELLEPAVAGFPGVFEYQRDLQTALIADVETCLLADDAVNGKQRWKVLAERLVSGRKVFPNERLIVSQMQEWLPPWCEHLRDDGQTEEAARLWHVLVAGSLWMAAPETLSGEQPVTPAVEARYANNAAWYLTICPEPSLQDLPRAVAMATRSVNLTPENVNHLHTLAVALYRSGDYIAARAALEKAVVIDMRLDHVSPLQNAGAALRALTQGNPVGAQRSAEAIIGLRGRSAERSPQLHSMLAMTLWRLGDHEAARSMLSTVPEPAAGFTKNGPQQRRALAEAKALITAP